jgi:chaperone modulatory protein CbpM
VNIEVCEALHVDEHGEVSFTQLIEYSGLPEGALRELVAYGAIAPIDPGARSWSFTVSALGLARTAERLRRDFELDANAVSVVLRYMERIEALENELRALRARRPELMRR